MSHNFNNIIARHNTNSLKFDGAKKRGKPTDAIPMWVADTDFAAPNCVLNALQHSVSQGIFGYSEPNDNYYNILSNWLKQQHNTAIEADWVLHSPGIVFALNVAIRAYTDIGDAVLIQTPVYYPFMSSVTNNNRKLVTNALQYSKKTNKYEIDFYDFEQKIIANKVKLFVLCSPHNPVGRVWTKQELKQLGDICLKNNVLVVSDEIWADLVYAPNIHNNFYSVDKNFLDNSIICFAPSKTFNLAGLQFSDIIIADKSLRNKFNFEFKSSGYEQLNTLGIVAAQAAYSKDGAEYLTELLAYLKQNRDYLSNFIKQNLPQINMVEAQATYLAWLDFKNLNLPHSQTENLLLTKAKIWLSSGTVFCPQNGKNFFRLNFACPIDTLKKACDKILQTLHA